MDVVLFHHVMGRTTGMREMGEALADDGRHRVVVPDLYDEQIADSLEGGFAIRREIGPETLDQRVEEAMADIDGPVVVAGVSMGVMTAQHLAQTRRGVIGALLYESCAPVGEDGFGPWPDGVSVQIHGMDDDEFFAHEGDLDAARELVAAVGPHRAEVFTYAGSQHLFLDNSLGSYDAAAADVAFSRSRDFLRQLEDA